MKKTTRFAALLLTIVMILSTSTICYAANGHFDDVPSKHWAYNEIETMAEGGLVNGYGNRKFGPEDTFTIAQMATIISNALGYEGYSKDGFWAYGYVEYCINTLKCLPSHGAINAANYSVPITRELTVHMLINSIGVKNSTGFEKPITVNDIPDIDKADSRYVDAIVAAFRNGMTVGVDANKTFNPKGKLTRAQGVVMLVRAGFTEAAEKPTVDADRIDSATAWANIKKLGEHVDISTKDQSSRGISQIRFSDPKTGGIIVQYNSKTGVINVIAKEENEAAMYNDKGNFIDVNGKEISWPFNEETYEYYASTGYGLEARRFVKRIATCVVGSAGAEEVYEGMKGVFLGTRYDQGGGQPCAMMWSGNRPVTIFRDSVNPIVSVAFGALDDEIGYKMALSDRVSGMQIPPSYQFSFEHAVTAYKLNQW